MSVSIKQHKIRHDKCDENGKKWALKINKNDALDTAALFNLHVLCLGNERCSWVRPVIKNIFSSWTLRDDDSKMGGTKFFLLRFLDSHVLCLIIYLRHSIALNTLFLISHLTSLKFDDENLCKHHKLWETSIKHPSLHKIYFRLTFRRSMIIISRHNDCVDIEIIHIKFNVQSHQPDTCYGNKHKEKIDLLSYKIWIAHLHVCSRGNPINILPSLVPRLNLFSAHSDDYFYGSSLLSYS